MNFFIVIFSSLLSIIFGYLRVVYTYWELHGVKQLNTHFLFGNFFKLKEMHLLKLLHEVYQEFKGQAKIAGSYIYFKPVAVALDLDLVKTILIKDFNKFTDRALSYNTKADILAGHLFLLQGEEWRSMRTKLTPTFTSGKMKCMFPNIVNVANQFCETVEHELSNNGDGILEIYDVNGRYTTDVIGNCIFGIECNCLKNPDVEFRKMGRLIFPRQKASRPIRWRLFLDTYSNYLKLFGLKRTPSDLQDFFLRMVRDTIALRERNNIQRNDFLNLLMEIKNKKDPNTGKPALTIDQVTAQAFVFFAAGFETSSSNMTYALYELAKNPHIQNKLRMEILDVLEKHNNELTYEAMMEMTYLDQVVSETLRKYPALAGLTRYAKEDYQIPDTEITIEKGTRVFIPVSEIHYDPDIYENPDEFRPERFSPDEVQKRHPQAFLGFGDGPRNCIGLRFGRMQSRVGLITLLKLFKFSTCSRTPEKLPFSEHSFVLVPGVDVYLKVEKYYK